MTDLKACPFCGGKAVKEANFGLEWWVQCENDHSTGIIYESPNEAEAAWNTRASDRCGGSNLTARRVAGTYYCAHIYTRPPRATAVEETNHDDEV